MNFESFDYSAQLTSDDVVIKKCAGDIIFEIGQFGLEMYVVKSGAVQIRVGSRILDTVHAGGTLGEMAILDGVTRSATAVALTDCEIVAIDMPRLLEIVHREPRVGIAMTCGMVRRLRSMNHHAQYDPLTHLPNRILFCELCQSALHRMSRTGMATGILHLDLDHFEIINDSLGHAVGDEVLGQVAARLRNVLRQTDSLARLGADEFAVLIEDVDTEISLAVTAERMRDAMAEPFIINGEALYITASIGIACCSANLCTENDVDLLLKHADAAMHEAKRIGRNQCLFFSQNLNDKAIEFLAIKNALREAVDRNELFLHYQPRVDLATNRILGVEALLRWNHPVMGMISPGRFIPIAEETGIIEAVGHFALWEGCRQRKAWLDAGLDSFRVAVNLSAVQMRHADLVDNICCVLKETGLPPEYLELEITESVLACNLEVAVERLNVFRAMGITIALDDFGTGYSSLSYVKRFPLDYMKIDQSFVRGISTDADDVAITRTIISLARNLGLKTVMEGVETEAQLAFARTEGCDEFQGFLFSTPVSASDAEVLLRKRRIHGDHSVS